MAMKKLVLLAGFLSITFTTNAQSIVKGYVYADKNGNGKKEKNEKGLSNIPVSNGIYVTTTDKSGRYELPVGNDNIIFVIKPAGFSLPVNKDNLPQFYYIHKPEGSPQQKYQGVQPTGKIPQQVNFALIPTEEKENFRILVFGDPQIKIRQQLDFFNRGIIDEVKGIKNVLFGMSLGDIVGNNLTLFAPYSAIVSEVGIPWYNVMGNHDMNHDAKSDSLADETFEAHFGPNTYAFNYGRVHFIILDDILDPDPVDGKGYRGGLRPTQLTFIKNDLKYVPKDHLIVLAFHIPLRAIRDGDREQLFELLKDFPHTLSLSAHTHRQNQYFYTKKDGWLRKTPHYEYNVGTTSGSWYSGIFNERNIPISTMKDGTPKGYAFITFKGNDYVIDYQVAGKPADYQIRISAPKVVAHQSRSAAAIYANYFMGSSKDTLWYRIDEGKWKTMTYAPGFDQYYLNMLHKWDYTDSLLEGRRPGPPRESTHLWKAPIKTNLKIGQHTIEVKVTDQHGRSFTQKRTYRIEEPIYTIYDR